jgi:inner membrane transporter RhtA
VAILRGRASARAWAVVARAGVILLSEPWHGGTDFVGVVLALAAAACWRLYIVLTKRAGDEVTVSGRALSPCRWRRCATIRGVRPPSVTFARLLAAAFRTLMSLGPTGALVIGLLVLGQIPRMLH